MNRVKRILTGILLIALPLVAHAQSNRVFSNLYSATVSNLADQLAVVQGDSTVRMTIGILTDFLQDSIYAHRSDMDDLVTDIGVNTSTISALGDSVTWISDSIDIFSASILALGSAVTDHGDLTGLSGDDHTQYLNTSRANSWFVTKDHNALLNSGDSTHAQIDAHLANTSNPHSVTSTQVLPSQTGNSGKYLQTNGTSVLWAAGGGGGGGGDSTTMSVDTLKRYTAGHGLWLEDEGLWIKDSMIVDTTIEGVNIIDFAWLGTNSLVLKAHPTASSARGSWILLDTVYARFGYTGYSGASPEVRLQNDAAYLEPSTLTKGFEYLADLSTLTPGDSTVVWKKYVDDAISAGAGADSTFISLTTGTIYEYAAGSGVTIDGLRIKDAGIEVGAGEELFIETTEYTGQITIKGFDSSPAANFGYFFTGGGEATMGYYDDATGDVAVFGASQNGILYITDELNEMGAVYNSVTYRNNFVDSSLVDKGYVDSLINTAQLLLDTLTFTFGFGVNHPLDTAACFDGAILGGFYNEQDTIVFRGLKANCFGTGGSFQYKIVQSSTYLDPTPTSVYSGNVTTAGGEISLTGVAVKIPPNVHVWAHIYNTPTGKATHAKIDFEYTKIRAN